MHDQQRPSRREGLKLRRDAEANRKRIIEAGRTLLQEHGGDLPVERFCEVANVNRATFYRNFVDRSALYSAINEYELALMTSTVQKAKHPLAFLTALAEMMTVYDRFVASLADLPEFAATPENNSKVRDAIKTPLARAKAEGLIRQHITEDDIFVIARMIGSGWRLDLQSSREEALRRRLRLVMEGLCPATPVQDTDANLLQ